MMMPSKMIMVLLLGFMFTLLYASVEPFISKKTIDAVGKKYGKHAAARVTKLLKIMNALRNKSEAKKLIIVNKYFNQVPYKTDMEVWGKKDYWATRMEFLGRDMGDCEDYAAAKYFTLVQLGVSPKKLFLTYAKYKKTNTAHMVLTYFKKPKSVPLVLDSLVKKIMPASKRKDLVPVYSFSGDELYLAKQKGMGKKVPSALKKNKKWAKLMNDVQSNKI